MFYEENVKFQDFLEVHRHIWKLTYQYKILIPPSIPVQKATSLILNENSFSSRSKSKKLVKSLSFQRSHSGNMTVSNEFTHSFTALAFPSSMNADNVRKMKGIVQNKLKKAKIQEKSFI